MTSIATQRLIMPRKENTSRNCLLKNSQNENKQVDNSKCENGGIKEKMTDTSIKENRTGKKFIAPLPPLSTSTAYEKKYKSFLAQREAVYDKNLKSIKCNLGDKFGVGNVNMAQRDSYQQRMNKFRLMNRVLNRERSRSITARKENADKSNLKTTPRELDESLVSDWSNSKELNQYNTKTDLLTDKKENGRFESLLGTVLGEKENTSKVDTACYQTDTCSKRSLMNIEQNLPDKSMGKKNRIMLGIDMNNYHSEMNQRDLNLKINDSLDLIFEDGDELLTEKDSDLLEIYMNDKLIFNHSGDLALNSTIDHSKYGSTAGNHIQIQHQYEYNIPFPLTGEISGGLKGINTNGCVNSNNQHTQHLSQIPIMISYDYIQDHINKINLGLFTSNYENLKANKEFIAKFSTEEYRRVLSTFLRYEYGKEIMEELYSTEEVNEKFLGRHEVTERMRMRMIDWMIEVLANYKCEENTFFLAVNIMDRYFRSTETSLKPENLHIIGVCSMFIASKFYDIYPMKLKLVVEKVGHGKFSSEEIKQTEEEIVKALNYEILRPTSFDFINLYFEEIFFFVENNFCVSDETLSEYFKKLFSSCGVEIKLDYLYFEKYKNTKKFTLTMLNLLRHVVLYLAKMNCHDYSLIAIKPSLLAASSIFVAMKICEQLNTEDYINEYFINKLIEISRQNEYDLLFYSQKILQNAQNFDLIFNGLENLKKVHFNYILELKNSK